MSNKDLYIHKKTFKCLEGGIPNGTDWIKIPDEAEECYYFYGSYPDVPDDLLFYTKDLEATWSDYYWSDNVKSDSPTYQEIKNYIKEFGKLVWKRNVTESMRITDETFNPLVPQEGGDHYKLRPIQPIEYSERNGLSMCQGNIVKYITRHKEKNGVEDLAKVVHYALLEAFFVYGESYSTELKEKILDILDVKK